MRPFTFFAIATILTVLGACATKPASHDEQIISDVTALITEWNDALPEGRVEDFKELYSEREGFLWAERGQFLYQSKDDIAAGIDQVMAGGTTISNEITSLDIVPLSQAAAAFSITMTSTATMQGMSFTFDGIVTGLAVKDEGTWKLYRGHLSEPR